jgi:hypothetical protein
LLLAKLVLLNLLCCAAFLQSVLLLLAGPLGFRWQAL